MDDGKKRLLSLDGGGIMGLIAICVLERIERQLRDAHGGDPDFRLRDYFDYFAGTSTGAIIAAGLAIGKSAAELKRFYTESGPMMFSKAGLWRRLRYKFEAENLRRMLKTEFGEESILDLQRAGTLPADRHLLIVTRNVNTDSPWPVSTNPRAKYNDETRPDCNRRLPLWQLVRASTAAPTFFAPERLRLNPDLEFLFEDGGITPYNNPAFLLFRMATEPAYRCGWPAGEDRLMLVSIGTGIRYRTRLKPNMRGEALWTTAGSLPGEFMRAMAVEQDICCRTVGRCVYGMPLDNEIGDLVSAAPDPARPKAFTYARYETDLSDAGLAHAGVAHLDPDRIVMDNVGIIPELQQIGAAAAQAVDLPAQFGAFLPAGR